MKLYQPTKKHVILLLIACFFIIDRLLKMAALQLFLPKPLIGQWLQFALYKNTGLAFSLQTGFNPLWLIALIFFGGLIWLYVAWRRQRYNEMIALTAIVLGAYSNMYDRLVFGAVIDYVELFSINISNIADWLIVGGALFLIYSELVKKKAG